MTDNGNIPTKQSDSDSRLPVRPGTIVWGGILLLVAAIAAAATVVDASIYTPRFILWAIVGFGGLLILAGAIGAVARISSGKAADDAAPHYEGHTD
ncbi:uncharacterized protein DUF3995 [Glaciihabitans tibetensis]|uniref:Uncharacterized protein DUF3995 n=1 Tax=Glaciihabitans tibetensis TaxID=1266600 RepID=A0A2T0V727_9MICO|nr:DUF3995 domain-containing protein [Glaciihabitans tibetensis]PRY65995.1 uncharacterized protein DUF3995 [Glaciihabitans tibetensis]